MVLGALLLVLQAAAGPPQEELRRQEELLLQNLANPLAAMASMKLAADFDYHVGPLNDGHRTTLQVEPTVPLHLGDEWNLVSRTALPLIYQEDVAPGAGNQTGLGDLTEALYIAMVKPWKGGWVVGIGPLLRAPTGTDDLLTARKWALGPSAAAVRQEGDFTFGLILAQLWSIGGSGQRPDIDVGSFEPFITYRAEGLWNLSLHLPFAYDFIAHQWTLPITLTVEKLVSFQKHPVTISFGFHYWADSPDSGPHDLAFEFGLTIVVPN